ncbi:MAG: hypothetical protein ABUT39_26015 [Acidobacteriota bacterium]
MTLLLLLGCGAESSAPGPAPAPSPPPAPEPAAAAVTDPFGYYFLDEAAGLPDWARAIDHLHLSTFNMKDGEEVTVPLYGFIRMKEDAGGADAKLIEPRIEGLHLTFTTEEIGGVSFAFEGDFQQPGIMPIVVPQGVALKGTLRRLEKGAPAGELNASFLYSAGD